MPSPMMLSAQACLPADGRALLVGRAWVPSEQGPSVVAVRGAEAVDLTRSYPTEIPDDLREGGRFRFEAPRPAPVG